MVHNFTLKEHEDTGYNGWVLDTKPYFDPVDGIGVAHDVLEEFPRGQDQPHDELMAIGALIFGRGSMSGAFNRRGLHEVVGGEFHELMRHVYDEDNYYLTPAPSTKPLGEDWEREEEVIVDAGEYAREYFPTCIDSGEFTEEQVREIIEFIPDACNWLRIGFRRARRRYYPHFDGYDVASMFERIQREVDKVTKYAEEYDKLRVIVSYRRHDLQVIHIPRYEAEGW
jgi:hypothetical protein